jgi:hypothetical protein
MDLIRVVFVVLDGKSVASRCGLKSFKNLLEKEEGV